ncbi:MAG TPA: DUF692 family protein [Burkholderiaceae bacterium]|nr:DUF692 family protein [Burkholderiaceae bacterium]
MTAAVDRPVPGVGVTWTSALDPLLNQAGLVDWVEFEPQTTWLVAGPGAPPRAPRAVLDHLVRLPARKLVHSVAAPVGGDTRPTAQHLALLREAVRALGVPWASEHLSFNAAHGVCTGFFMPPRQTSAQVKAIADNIRRLQDALGVPVAIENGTSYLRPRSDEMPDGEFVAEVAEAADCGLLLDLHNAYANATNGRQALTEFLNVLPLHRVWEIHLAGGMLRDGFWLDAHCGAVPGDLWRLVDGLPHRLPALRVVNFEIFPTFLPEVGTAAIVEELQRIRAWLDAGSPAGARPTPTAPAPVLTLRDVESDPALSDRGGPWEAALTALVTGQPLAADDPETVAIQVTLEDEAGVPLVRDLVFSFRASMVVQVLRLSSRLLLCSVGPAVFRRMLQDTFEHHPPALYASLEAQAFASQVEQRGWRVPHLATLLRYELALAQTLIDGRSRVVEFPFEPMPMLRALADGRLPDEIPQQGRFEIEILPESDAVPG